VHVVMVRLVCFGLLLGTVGSQLASGTFSLLGQLLKVDRSPGYIHPRL
jgi:hypothetical protein